MKKTMINLWYAMALFFPFSHASRFRKLRSFLELEKLKKSRSAEARSANAHYTGVRGVVKAAH